MTWKKIIIEELGAEAKVSAYTPKNGVAEYHLLIQASSRGNLQKAREFLLETDFQGLTISAKRLYSETPVEISGAIGQKPLGDYAFAEWLYLKNCPDTHNGYSHLWDIGMRVSGSNPLTETKTLLETYERRLAASGGKFVNDCIRTWFFVDDIDNNYAGFVKARKDNFESIGLTEKTHYIASTGICGRPAGLSSIVQMDAYSILGLDEGQTKFLYAPTHLNPTYEYGVTFERGTKVQYGDRSHIFISGTASIDNHGNVLFHGDVASQTKRMWENVDALLQEAGASFSDIAQIIVYIRNESDRETVANLFEDKFPKTPYIITHAAVCRPEWLIEMECIAVTPDGDSRFRDF